MRDSSSIVTGPLWGLLSPDLSWDRRSSFPHQRKVDDRGLRALHASASALVCDMLMPQAISITV